MGPPNARIVEVRAAGKSARRAGTGNDTQSALWVFPGNGRPAGGIHADLACARHRQRGSSKTSAGTHVDGGPDLHDDPRPGCAPSAWAAGSANAWWLVLTDGVDPAAGRGDASQMLDLLPVLRMRVVVVGSGEAHCTPSGLGADHAAGGSEWTRLVS